MEPTQLYRMYAEYKDSLGILAPPGSPRDLKLYLLWLNGYSAGLAVWADPEPDAPSQAGLVAHEKFVSEVTASVGEVSTKPDNVVPFDDIGHTHI